MVVPDEEMGEQVKAVVQLHDERRAGPALEAALIAFCRERLSPIKCPRSIDFEAELPRAHRQADEAAAARPLLAHAKADLVTDARGRARGDLRGSSPR